MNDSITDYSQKIFAYNNGTISIYIILINYITYLHI